MSNADNRLHGYGGAIYIGGPKGTGIKVSDKTEWTYNRSRDYVDATVFGDINKVWLAGLVDLQGTYSGLLDNSGDLLLNAATSGAELIYLYSSDGTVAGTPTVLVAHGSGFLDATVNCSNTDAVKITGQYRASAAWVQDLT